VVRKVAKFGQEENRVPILSSSSKAASNAFSESASVYAASGIDLTNPHCQPNSDSFDHSGQGDFF
jgi:hypothetical protein